MAIRQAPRVDLVRLISLALLPAWVCILLFVVIILRSSFVAEEEEKIPAPPQIASEFSLEAVEVGPGIVNSGFKISVRDNMIRSEVLSQDLHLLTIMRDGYSYTILPRMNINLPQQSALDWLFKSVNKWRLIGNQVLNEKRVDVYEISLIRDGELTESKLFYDPSIKFPVKIIGANGKGWELKKFSSEPLEESEFRIPPELVNLPSRRNDNFCPKGQSPSCSGGWSCGDPCPGGNCC